MTQLALTLPEARARRDAGMQIAADHAEAVSAGFAEEAFAALVIYARCNGTFTAERFRHESRLSIPTTGKALGPVFRRAAREGVIEKGGFAISQDRHLSPAVLWNSLVYRSAA